MKTLVHTSPLGALSIPGVAGEIAPGEPFTVDEELAAKLLEQSDVFALAVATKGAYDHLKLGELGSLAQDRGVVAEGARKADLVAALMAADAAAADTKQPPVVIATEPAADESVDTTLGDTE